MQELLQDHQILFDSEDSQINEGFSTDILPIGGREMDSAILYGNRRVLNSMLLAKLDIRKY
jgi:hypothetical protein